MNQSVDDLLTWTAGQLIVSGQACPAEPMRTPDKMARVGTAMTHPLSLTRCSMEEMH